MKKAALIIGVILFCSFCLLAQTKRKTGTGYFQSYEGGNAIGTYYLKINGVERSFTWTRATRMKNVFNNAKATTVGAQWNIVYEECDDEGVCPRLISVAFTGRIKQ